MQILLYICAMPLNKLSLINLTKLAKAAKVNYFKIYFRKNGTTKMELDQNDKTKIVNAIHKDIKPLFEELGFEVTVNPIPGR